jgi:hypothetical protein
MFEIKYWSGHSNYSTHAEGLSALINQHLSDTCEITEGERGQFDVYRNGELLLSKEHLQRFPEYADVKYKMETNHDIII